MEIKKRIFFIYGNHSTFVNEDIQFLSEEYDLTGYQFKPTKNSVLFIYALIRLLYHLTVNIRKYDVYYSWFCDFYTLLPFIFGKIFRKKTMVVVGGFDAVSIPQLNYGIFSKKNLRYWFVINSYKLANYILPVDKSLIKGINNYGSSDGKGVPTGIKNYLPDIKANFVVLPTGYDQHKWDKGHELKEDNTVISIASVPDMRTFILKGFDFLLEIAREMPDVKFSIIGLNNKMKAYAESIKTSNVHLLGFIDNRELPSFLAKQKVFAQFSLSEGLPNTLCESMLCECVPVGSNVNGIPTAIGDCGYIVHNKKVSEAVDAIRKALHNNNEMGKEARKKIISNFTKEKRRENLRRIIDL